MSLRFLDFPPEIRNCIYTLLLPNEQVHIKSGPPSALQNRLARFSRRRHAAAEDASSEAEPDMMTRWHSVRDHRIHPAAALALSGRTIYLELIAQLTVADLLLDVCNLVKLEKWLHAQHTLECLPKQLSWILGEACVVHLHISFTVWQGLGARFAKGMEMIDWGAPFPYLTMSFDEPPKHCQVLPPSIDAAELDVGHADALALATMAIGFQEVVPLWGKIKTRTVIRLVMPRHHIDIEVLRHAERERVEAMGLQVFAPVSASSTGLWGERQDT